MYLVGRPVLAAIGIAGMTALTRYDGIDDHTPTHGLHLGLVLRSQTARGRGIVLATKPVDRKAIFFVTGPPTLGRFTAAFLRIGNTTFGGGDPTMAALQRELIERQGWITADDYAIAVSLARITPGTNILAFCAAVGARILGIRGAIAAVAAVTVPSAALAIFLTQGYESWRTNPTVMAAFAGTAAAVAGMMWASVWLLVRPHVRGWWKLLRAGVFFGGAFLAAWKFGVTPIPIIATAALAGFLWKE